MITDSEAPAPRAAYDWLSVRQVALAVGVDRKIVYEALFAGELTGSQPCEKGTWKVHRTDVDAWIEARARRADWLSPAQVQERTGYGRNFVYEALRRGELPAEKEGGKWLIHPNAVDGWIRANQRAPA